MNKEHGNHIEMSMQPHGLRVTQKGWNMWS